MFIQVLSTMMCYAFFLGSKNDILHSKIECTANYFTVFQSLRLSKSIYLMIKVIPKVHIHHSITHRMSRIQNQEIKKFFDHLPFPHCVGSKQLKIKHQMDNLLASRIIFQVTRLSIWMSVTSAPYVTYITS